MMRSTYLFIKIILIFGLLIGNGLFAQKKNSLKFVHVVDKLELGKNTSLAAKQYWLSIKGEKVSWKGVVKDVKGGRGKAAVYINKEVKPSYKGFNVLLSTYDLEKAAQLKIGQTVKFSGYLNRYKAHRNHVVVIYLRDVEFIK